MKSNLKGKRKKICMVYYALHPHNVLLKEAEALREKGWEIDVICLARDSIGKEKYTEGINIYKIQTRKFDERGVFSYCWKYARFFISCSFLLVWLSLKHRYSIVHVTTPPDFMVFVSALPKILGAKVILDIHDITPEFFAAKFGLKGKDIFLKILEMIEKISATFSDHVITVTDLWKLTLTTRSVSESKCSVLLNVPDNKIFNPTIKRERVDDENFVLLYPGRLDFGVNCLIKAMPIIIRQIPNAKLEIYGLGASFLELKKLSEDLGTDRHVRFNEPVNITQLAQIMANADVGIDPMKSGVFFGDVLSVKSLEFLTLGIPLVISRTKATEYYYDQSMVMFFEPDNDEDLARAVIELYNNPRKGIELANNSKRFSKMHNWDRYKRTYYNILDSLCKRP